MERKVPVGYVAKSAGPTELKLSVSNLFQFPRKHKGTVNGRAECSTSVYRCGVKLLGASYCEGRHQAGLLEARLGTPVNQHY
jgi:hypothetical protein